MKIAYDDFIALTVLVEVTIMKWTNESARVFARKRGIRLMPREVGWEFRANPVTVKLTSGQRATAKAGRRP